MSASTLAVASTQQSLGVQSLLPSGLASAVAGSSSITVQNISPLLTATSIVQATVQVPDQDTLGCWLVYATPSSANGGQIYIVLSQNASASSTLVVEWAVVKF